MWWDEIGALVDVDFGGNAGLWEIFTTHSREFNADSFVIWISKLSYTIYRNCAVTISFHRKKNIDWLIFQSELRSSSASISSHG